MALRLSVVTPREVAYRGEAEAVRVPGWKGEMGVLEHHEQYLAISEPGRVVIVTVEGEKVLIVGRGFVEVGADHVTLLTDHVEESGAVSPEEAATQLREAEAELVELTEGSALWADAQRKAGLARARLG